jgi:hypothetical protein
MIPVKIALMILAVACFLVSALGYQWPRPNLTAAGLFFWALSILIQ